MPLQLRNPHSVIAALQTRPEAVREIRLPEGTLSPAWQEAMRLAEDHRVPVSRRAAAKKSRQHQSKTGRAGGGEALVQEKSPVELDQLFAETAQHGGRHGLWLALEQIQDPHNVGAIVRTAAFFGVRGIVLTRDRSAPLNATVYDVASGGIEYVPFSVQSNLAQALDKAKQSDLWVLGTSEHADQDVAEIPSDRPWLLVLGNEEKGLRRLTRQRCDELCRLTPQTPVTSLNVSVAAGVFIAAISSRPGN